MSKHQNYRLFPNIRNVEDLGVAVLGSPIAAIVFVPRERQINRAEYGRRLAAIEGGNFTKQGYLVPSKQEVNEYAT